MKVIVRALVRWFWLLVLCLIVGWFGGKALAATLPPTYQATALVQLNAQSRTSQIIQPVSAYGALVTSDSLLNPVLKKYQQIDRQSFIKQLVVVSDSHAQTISIQVTLPQARVAQDVANTLAQSLVTQQNAAIKAQYTQQIRIDGDRINAEQKKIDQLNQQYVRTAQITPPNTALLQQLNNQAAQEQTLQNQDISARQALITEQTLFSTPLSVVQFATLPNKPSSILGLIPWFPAIVLVLLILGFVFIYFLESRAGRIHGIYAVQQKTTLPVLGSLRWTAPSPQKVSIQQFLGSKTPYAEDCRIMMADVLFHAEEAQAHVLTVTGLKAQSGTSSIASQLAAQLAQSKRHVLLIDANLQEPSQHQRFGLPNKQGLAGMLEEAQRAKVVVSPPSNQMPLEIGRQISSMETSSMAAVPMQTPITINKGRLPSRNTRDANGTSGRAVEMYKQQFGSENRESSNGVSGYKRAEFADGLPVGSHILPTSIQNLYVLPAGKPTMNPVNLLSMPEMYHLLKWAAQRSDFVVIDCPALIHAESHVLGSLSDQTFLVVDATKDRLPQIVNMKEELMSTGMRLSGLLVNKLGRWI